MSQQSMSEAFRGFTNPVDPSPEELRTWAHRPESVPLHALPPDWDLMVANDRLIKTLYELAATPTCPARHFALHCLYLYAADAVRTGYRAHPSRRLRKLLARAERSGEDQLQRWAHNVRYLMSRPSDFNYHDWCEGGLVREQRIMGAHSARAGGGVVGSPADPRGLQAG